MVIFIKPTLSNNALGPSKGSIDYLFVGIRRRKDPGNFIFFYVLTKIVFSATSYEVESGYGYYYARCVGSVQRASSESIFREHYQKLDSENNPPSST